MRAKHSLGRWLRVSLGIPAAVLVVSTPVFPTVAQETPAVGEAPPTQPLSQPGLMGGSLLYGSTATLPLFPSTFFGFAGAPVTYNGTTFLPEILVNPKATQPGTVVSVTGIEPPNADPVPSSVLLPRLVPGAMPIQAGDPRAPEIIFRPSIGVSEGFDDNPRSTPSTLADSVSHFSPGFLLSADTPHFQGLLNYQLDYFKYARATDEDQFSQNLIGYGLGTIVPGAVYVDARAAISQLSTAGGAGFTTNPALLPEAQQTQAMVTSLTPIIRQSFGDLVDADLRYNFGMVRFSNPSLLGGPALPAPTSSSLADIDVNRGTLALAIGHGYGVMASRLTLDAANIGSSSVAQSDQFRGFDDLEYHVSNRFALLSRIGYEDLQYDTAHLHFDGPILKIGARVDLAPDSAATALYGRQDGIWSFEGRFRQQITASTALLASYQRRVSSVQDLLLTDFNTSRLDAFGTLINEQSALPTGLGDPEFAYAITDIYRYQTVRAGLTSDVGRNSFRVFGFLDHEASLTGLSSDDTSRGLLLQWFRLITPRLTGGIGVGYATHVVGNEKTLTADVNLTYQVSAFVTAFVRYDLTDSEGNTVGTTFRRNLVELGMRVSY